MISSCEAGSEPEEALGSSSPLATTEPVATASSLSYVVVLPWLKRSAVSERRDELRLVRIDLRVLRASVVQRRFNVKTFLRCSQADVRRA